MKKKLICLLAVFMLLAATGNTYAAEMITITQNPITVTYNGDPILFTDAAPQVINGRTLVPVRPIMERAKLTVDFNGENRTVTAYKEGYSLKMVLDQTTAEVTEKGVTKVLNLDEPAQIIENRTFVPIRFIAESLGIKVNWNPFAREVVLIDTAEWKDEISANSLYLAMLLDKPFQTETPNAGDSACAFTLNYAAKNIPDMNGYPTNPEVNLTWFSSGTHVFDGENSGSYTSVQSDFSQLSSMDKDFLQKLLPGFDAVDLSFLAQKHGAVIERVADTNRTVYMKTNGMSDLFHAFRQHHLATFSEDSYVAMQPAEFLSLFAQNTDLTSLEPSLKTARTPWEFFTLSIFADDMLYSQSVKLIDSLLHLYTKLYADELFVESDPWNGVYYKKYAPAQNHLKETLYEIHRLKSQFSGKPLDESTVQAQKEWLDKADLEIITTVFFNEGETAPTKTETTFSLRFYDQPIPNISGATRDVTIELSTGETHRDFQPDVDKIVTLPNKFVLYK